MKALAILGVVLALAAGVWALLGPGFGNQKQVARGAILYANNCASCHGAALEGQADWQIANDDGSMPAPPHNEDGHTWHHSDRLLFDYVKLGGDELFGDTAGFISGMPGFADTLSDQDILDILAYFRTFWSERAQQYQQEINQNDS